MIIPHILSDKQIGVFGLARTGVAAVRALQAAGTDVRAWDDNADRRAPLTDVAADLYHAELEDLDALVLAPGVPLSFPKPHPIVARAQAANVPLMGDMDLFQAARESLPAHTLVGVTGTNGKSTTVTLIAHILSHAGRPAVAAGNIGVPVLSLAPLEAGGTYVFELSSFQLDLTQALTCDVAVLLNITPDHLDRHGSMTAYAAAKERLFSLQNRYGAAIVCTDTEPARTIADRLGRPFISVSTQGRKADIWVTAKGELADKDGPIVDLTQASALQGRHNWQNAAVAYAVVRLLGLSVEQALAGLLSFGGLAHRQEPVAEHNGVRFINDSKATNWEAAATALSAFERIHWIAGGQLKEENMASILPVLHRVMHVYLIGEATDILTDRLGGQLNCIPCGTVARAVEAAAHMARPGDVVLLSPGCASFDHYADFEARGEDFRAHVQALVAGGGAI